MRIGQLTKLHEATELLCKSRKGHARVYTQVCLTSNPTLLPLYYTVFHLEAGISSPTPPRFTKMKLRLRQEVTYSSSPRTLIPDPPWKAQSPYPGRFVLPPTLAKVVRLGHARTKSKNPKVGPTHPTIQATPFWSLWSWARCLLKLMFLIATVRFTNKTLYQINLLWRFYEIIHLKCLAQCLFYRKHSES